MSDSIDFHLTPAPDPVAVAAPVVMQMRCVGIRHHENVYILEDHVMKFRMGLTIPPPAPIEEGQDYDVLVNMTVYPRGYMGKTW